MAADTTIVAGTTIARHGCAALIRGRPGRGKSDLALRAICQPLQLPNEMSGELFHLVSDDQTLVERRDDNLLASAPEPLRGLLEVRGIGIISTQSVAAIPLVLIVDIDQPVIERLPDYPGATEQVLGNALDVVYLSALEASAPLKVALALARSARHHANVT